MSPGSGSDGCGRPSNTGRLRPPDSPAFPPFQLCSLRSQSHGPASPLMRRLRDHCPYRRRWRLDLSPECVSDGCGRRWEPCMSPGGGFDGCRRRWRAYVSPGRGFVGCRRRWEPCMSPGAAAAGGRPGGRASRTAAAGAAPGYARLRCVSFVERAMAGVVRPIGERYVRRI